MVNNFYDAHTLTTKVEHVAQIKLKTNHCFPVVFHSSPVPKVAKNKFFHKCSQNISTCKVCHQNSC